LEKVVNVDARLLSARHATRLNRAAQLDLYRRELARRNPHGKGGFQQWA